MGAKKTVPRQLIMVKTRFGIAFRSVSNGKYAYVQLTR